MSNEHEYDKDVLAQAIAKLAEISEGALTHNGRERVDNVTLHTDGICGEDVDGESGIVALGDWNDVSEWKDGRSHSVDDAPVLAANALEKLGVEIGWCDEYEPCRKCNKLARTQPTHYGWKADFWRADEETLICGDCVREDPSECLRWLEGNDNHCLAIDGIDLEDHGYEALDQEFEHGLYGGQDANPHKIGAALRKQGVHRYIFVLDSTGQFDLSFSVHIHDEHRDRLDLAKFNESDTRDDIDPAEAMRRHLQGCGGHMHQKGPGVTIMKMNPKDPDKPIIHTLTPQEFVEGKAGEILKRG